MKMKMFLSLNLFAAAALLAASPAGATEHRRTLECRGIGEDYFAGGITVHADSWRLMASAADNYVSGEAVCESNSSRVDPFAGDHIVCAGLWRIWGGPAADRLDAVITRDRDGNWVATLNRARLYGGKVTRMACKIHDSQFEPRDGGAH